MFSPAFDFVPVLDFSRSNKYVEVSHSFNLHLCNRMMPIIFHMPICYRCILFGEMSTQILYPLLH